MILSWGRMLASDIVTIQIGRRIYQPHKALLCTIVPYFSKAFGGGFIESKENVITVELDDNETEVFDLFLVWLYQGHQAISSSEVDLHILVKLYVLADMWCVPYLMDEIMRALIAKGSKNQRFNNYRMLLVEISGTLERYWADTAHLSKLRMFLKLWTIYVVDGCQSQDQAYAEAALRKICEASPDFSTELLLTYSREHVHGWWEHSWEHEDMFVSKT